MNMKNSRIKACLLAFCMAASVFPVGVSASEENTVLISEQTPIGLSHFTKVNTYQDGVFSDIGNTWYTENVKSVYELGLMIGSGNAFTPMGNISLAEALTLACRLYNTYYGIEHTYTGEGAWYQPYVSYAVSVGIIQEGQYADYTAIANRAEIATILANAVPAEALVAINTIKEGAIPDVDVTASYAKSVYRLYDAGILAGGDAAGTFYPERTITRAEVAAMVTRIADASLRLENKTINETVITKEDLDGYVIVRGEQASDTEITASTELQRYLQQVCGVELPIVTDTTEAAAKEFVMGETSRAASTQVTDTLAVQEYAIHVSGDAVVLAGGSDAATYQGVQAFLELTGERGCFALSKDTRITAEAESQNYLVALTNQGASLLEVYDISYGTLDETSCVWSYELPEYNIAGTKLRQSEKYGEVALVVCGGSYGCMISYPEGELLWYTKKAPDNPHSIELIPNGVVAIAGSDGNEVRFFTTTKKFTSKPAATVSLTDAHGVLWDEENEVLWTIGRDVLTAYKVTLNEDDTVTVHEDTSRRVTIPTDYAHDLSPVYGDTNALWVTTYSNVYQFDKTTKTFSTDYAGAEELNRSEVKGVGNFADGSLVYLYPDGEFKSWTTKSIVLLRSSKCGELMYEDMTSDTGHFYKVRVWCADYQ